MFKLLHNCTHFTCQQSNAQNSQSQALTVHGLRTSRCSSWIFFLIFLFFFSPFFLFLYFYLFFFKLDLEKAEEPESKLPTSSGSQKKQKNFRKTSTSASLTTLKPLTVWITTNCRKFLKRWEYKTTLPPYLTSTVVFRLLSREDS